MVDGVCELVAERITERVCRLMSGRVSECLVGLVSEVDEWVNRWVVSESVEEGVIELGK